MYICVPDSSQGREDSKASKSRKSSTSESGEKSSKKKEGSKSVENRLIQLAMTTAVQGGEGKDGKTDTGKPDTEQSLASSSRGTRHAKNDDLNAEKVGSTPSAADDAGTAKERSSKSEKTEPKEKPSASKSQHKANLFGF